MNPRPERVGHGYTERISDWNGTTPFGEAVNASHVEAARWLIDDLGFDMDDDEEAAAQKRVQARRHSNAAVEEMAKFLFSRGSKFIEPN